MAEAYIIDALRTPRGIGKVGKGALAALHPQQLAATTLRAIVARNGIDSAWVDDVIWSTSAQRGRQAGDLARMAALDAGLDIKVSGVTLDRYCGGGLTSVGLAAAQVASGLEDCLIAGGTEMMSYTGERDRAEIEAGLDPNVMGSLNPTLEARHPQTHQGVCADAIAAMEGITREALDTLGLESQRKAAAAVEAGHFDKALVPVADADGAVLLARDEYPRPQTTLESLANLRPAFADLADRPMVPGGPSYRQQILRRYPDLHFDGVHHAGNSSGVVDGAAALLVASRDFATRHGLRPRARIVAAVNMGDCPTLMLNAPVPAARKALARAGLRVADIDLWEINEAFAVVAEKFVRDLRLDRAKVNVNGGSIALGHPIGATGAILIGTLVDELERRGARYGLATMCAAGGMAPAVIVERVDGF